MYNSADLMKWRLIILFVVFTGTLAAQPQPEEAQDRKGKLFMVPEFWLSFGSTTYIEVAPMLGYHISDRIVVGAGPHYIYQSVRSSFNFPAYETHVFGLKGFARAALLTNAEEFLPINFFNDLFVHIEYEGMSLQKDYLVPDSGRDIYNLFLVGGGFNQRIGIYNSVSFMVLWDINETSRSPYTNPIFRIGFNTYF